METLASKEGHEAAARKKPYFTPKVVEYGSLEKLTQGGGGTMDDGTGLTMMCL